MVLEFQEQPGNLLGGEDAASFAGVPDESGMPEGEGVESGESDEGAGQPGTTEEQVPGLAATKAPKAPSNEFVPRRDLDGLRSTYDRKLAAASQQLEAALARSQQLEAALFESHIQAMPAEDQPAARAQVQAYFAKQQQELAVQQAQAQQAAYAQMLEPIARQTVLGKIAQRYKVPVAMIADAPSPEAAEYAAQRAAALLRRQAGQTRKASGADSFEGATGQPAQPDLVKQYANSGDIAGYLRALAAQGK